MADIPGADRYVAGTLDDEETARFEAAMIERPDLAADVAVRQRIRSGLGLLEERNQLEPLLGSESTSRSPVRWAFAAAVLAVAFTGSWFAFRPTAPAGAGALLAQEALAGRTVSGTFVFAATRSQAGLPTISLLANAGLVHIRLLSGMMGQLQVTLERKAPGRSDEAIGDHVIVRRPDAGMIDIYLDPAKLVSGEYELEVADGTKVERFGFILDLTEPASSG